MRLAEVNFNPDHVPYHVLERLTKIFRAMLTSICAEYAAREVRQRERANVAKKLTMVAKWHSVATSDILDNHDRNPIHVTDAAKQSAPTTLPASTFDSKVHDHSLGEQARTLTGNSTWLNISPQKRELCFASWRSFVTLGGDYEGFASTWQSLLAPTGHFLYHKNTEGHAAKIGGVGTQLGFKLF